MLTPVSEMIHVVVKLITRMRLMWMMVTTKKLVVTYESGNLMDAYAGA